MIGVTLKGLAGRKLRAILTAFAIVLGVGMISGTYVLTDTIKSAFNTIFEGSYKDTSAVISGKELVKQSASGNATVPEALLAKVKKLPDVEAASGALLDLGSSNSDQVKLIGTNGKTLGSKNSPSLGFGVDPAETRFNPLKLTAGSWASNPHEIVIDADTAKKEHYGVGDVIGAAANGPVRQYRISGIAKFGNLSSLGGATFAIFTVPTAQELLNKRGQLDAISVAAKSNVSPAKLVSEIRPLLPPTAQVRTGDAQAKADSADVNQFLKILQYVLLAFGGIALFVGGFVIFNTLSITIAQRTREFATLRTLGASRRQVLRSVIVEALVIGFVSSLIGLFLGLGLAKGLTWVFDQLSLSLPQGGTVFATRTIVVSLLVGTLITLLAGIAPAFRATRVPPIAAVREGAVLPKGRLAPFAPYIAVATIAFAVAALAVGLLVGGLSTAVMLLLIGLGCITLFIGVALISNRLVRPLAALVGAPARRLGGVAGKLAHENSTRNPGRTASTAAALMIGLALVTLVATLGAGLRASDQNALKSQVQADYVVTSKNGYEAFPKDAGDAVGGVSGIGAVSNVRYDRARVLDKTVDVDGVDPNTITQTFRYRWAKGSSETAIGLLGLNGALVKKSFADDHHLRIGSRFPLTTPAGNRFTYEVKGIFDPPTFDKVDSLLGQISISQDSFDSTFPRSKNLYTFVNAGTATEAALKKTLAAFPDTKLRTRDAWVTNRAKGINQLLNLLYVLLALSVIVSLFGMVNTLVLSVFERTRELGMLRAVGMTRRQVRRMIRHESVITALIGAALGLPLGVFLAALVTRSLSSYDVSFVVPVSWIVYFVVVAIAAGIAAAVFPARRAARLNVLEALQYE